jgi:hypothetical protein
MQNCIPWRFQFAMEIGDGKLPTDTSRDRNQDEASSCNLANLTPSTLSKRIAAIKTDLD